MSRAESRPHDQHQARKPPLPPALPVSKKTSSDMVRLGLQATVAGLLALSTAAFLGGVPAKFHEAVFQLVGGGANRTVASTSTAASAVYPESDRLLCRPFLPRQLLVDHAPPAATQERLRSAWEGVTAYLDSMEAPKVNREAGNQSFETVAVAVVTASGPLFVDTRGKLRVNDTKDWGSIDEHSMYRIASTGKLTGILLGWVLSEAGVLSWEDPVTKHIPSYASHQASTLPPTLLELATHMSGLGRDWPAGESPEWPYAVDCLGPPPVNCHKFPTPEKLLQAIRDTAAVSPPWTEPGYSNTATGLLGLALLEAAKAFYKGGRGGKEPPKDFADLARRWMFEPLGMKDSHYLMTQANKAQVVCPSHGGDVTVDQDFLDAMNNPGGQFSSLSDLIRLTQSILDPEHRLASSPAQLVSRRSMDRWLKPAVSFEEDDFTELGMMWEIVKHRDSRGRARKVYWKLGLMPPFGACLAVHPGAGYGVVVAMTSPASAEPDAAAICYTAFDKFQPAIDEVLDELARELYVGNWTSDAQGGLVGGRDGKTKVQAYAVVALDKGTLYVDELVYDGIDALGYFSNPPHSDADRVALRPQDRDEFRLDFGFPGFNGLKYMGCYPYWNAKDSWGVRAGIATELIYFTGKGADRTLHIPSMNASLKRS